MSQRTIVAGLAGMLLTLAAVGGFLTLDRGVLHWYAHESQQVDIAQRNIAPSATPRATLTANPGAPGTALVAQPTRVSTSARIFAAENRADCHLIRGTDYRSQIERVWFLNYCVTPTAARIEQAANSLPTIQIAPPISPPAAEPPLVIPSGTVIQTCIDGDFEGWSGDTVFVLCNGQVWMQSEYRYWYHYAYRPRVIIYCTGGECRMQLDGQDRSIGVVRLR